MISLPTRIHLLLLALAGFALGSCTVNPVTGRSELSLVSEQQELAIGAEQYGPSQQSQGGRYPVDENLTRYVSEVGGRIAAASDPEGFAWGPEHMQAAVTAARAQ